MLRTFLFACLLTLAPLASAQTAPDAVRYAIVGDALLTEGAYEALSTLSDRFGPRMVGLPGHGASMDWVEAELRGYGIATHRETFSFPGWRRGEESARMVAPMDRPLRAAALGYSTPAAPFEADLAAYDRSDMSPAARERYRGRIVLLPPNVRLGADEQQVLVGRHGALAFLLINRVAGGQLLARTANLEGSPAPAPMFVVTEEEGTWMQRLLGEGETVRVRLASTSAPEAMTGTNLVATLPGTLPRSERGTIVVGAHFDSWDLGQGAMDNGLGVAQLLEAARLLHQHSPGLGHDVAFVWFDAEEMGLWGSRAYAERHAKIGADTDVRAMLNLDMVGEPLGVNAMGFDALVPALQAAGDDLGAWRFSRNVENKPWLGSDHHPFTARGVPSITFYAPIDPDAVRYYHDLADTVDKIDRYELARASAIVALVTRSLALDTSPLPRLSPEETAALFEKAGLVGRLEGMGWWPVSPLVE